MNEEFQNDELTEATMQTIPRANVLGVGVSAINMEDAAFLSDRLLSRCTEIADLGAIFVNAFPRFNCSKVTVQLKIRDLSAARQQGEIDALTPKKRGPKVVVSLLVKENR